MNLTEKELEKINEFKLMNNEEVKKVLEEVKDNKLICLYDNVIECFLNIVEVSNDAEIRVLLWKMGKELHENEKIRYEVYLMGSVSKKTGIIKGKKKKLGALTDFINWGNEYLKPIYDQIKTEGVK